VEGDVFLEGRPLEPGSTKLESLQIGERLRTGNGRAEIVLASGRMLRLDRQAEVEMLADDLLAPELRLHSGSVIVEWTDIFGDGEALIRHADGDVRLRKAGRYRVDAEEGLTAELRVFDGKAWVQDEARSRSVGKRRLLALAEPDGKPEKFDAEDLDGFDRWNLRRSRIVARGNRQARRGEGRGGRGGIGRGRRGGRRGGLGGGLGDASRRTPGRGGGIGRVPGASNRF